MMGMHELVYTIAQAALLLLSSAAVTWRLHYILGWHCPLLSSAVADHQRNDSH
jgi:hypothetical protein